MQLVLYMNLRLFPFISKPSEIRTFTVLIVSVLLNLLTIFICYRMVENHTQSVELFLFVHNNKIYKYHPWLEKYDARLDLLEEKVNGWASNY